MTSKDVLRLFTKASLFHYSIIPLFSPSRRIYPPGRSPVFPYGTESSRRPTFQSHDLVVRLWGSRREALDRLWAKRTNLKGYYIQIASARQYIAAARQDKDHPAWSGWIYHRWDVEHAEDLFYFFSAIFASITKPRATGGKHRGFMFNYLPVQHSLDHQFNWRFRRSIKIIKYCDWMQITCRIFAWFFSDSCS